MINAIRLVLVIGGTVTLALLAHDFGKSDNFGKSDRPSSGDASLNLLTIVAGTR